MQLNEVHKCTIRITAYLQSHAFNCIYKVHVICIINAHIALPMYSILHAEEGSKRKLRSYLLRRIGLPPFPPPNLSRQLE